MAQYAEKWPNLKYVPNFGTKSGHFLKNLEFQDNVPNSGHSGFTAKGLGFLQCLVIPKSTPKTAHQVTYSHG